LQAAKTVWNYQAWQDMPQRPRGRGRGRGSGPELRPAAAVCPDQRVPFSPVAPAAPAPAAACLAGTTRPRGAPPLGHTTTPAPGAPRASCGAVRRVEAALRPAATTTE